MSGSTNAGDAFDLVAARRAAESTYAGIVRLVAAAQRSRAPMSRLADRYAMVFLAATVALAGAAWPWSGDPIRAVAVLVVATPCPLILAVPVAIVSGLSRAAKHGILIKGGTGAGDLGARALARHRQDRDPDARPGAHRLDRGRLGPVRPTSCCGSRPRSTRPPSTSSRKPLWTKPSAKASSSCVPGDVVETPGEGIEGRGAGPARDRRRRPLRRAAEYLGIGRFPVARRAPGRRRRRRGRGRRKVRWRPDLRRRAACRHGSAAAASRRWASSESCSPPAIGAMWPRWSRGACRSTRSDRS